MKILWVKAYVAWKHRRRGFSFCDVVFGYWFEDRQRWLPPITIVPRPRVRTMTMTGWYTNEMTAEEEHLQWLQWHLPNVTRL